MLLKYIQHFVTSEGSAIFPDWMLATISNMQKVDGFITAHYVFDPVDSHKIHFFMYFEDQAALQRWTETPQHTAALSTLSKHWIKPFEMKQFSL